MNKNKLLLYNITLYLLVLVAEGLTIFSKRMEKFNTGKVFSSLGSQLHEIIQVIWLDAIQYIVTVILIFLAFAWLNHKIIDYIYSKIQKKYQPKSPEIILGIVFISINILFFATTYFLNSTLYPLSQQNIFINSSFFNIDTETAKNLFFIICGLYFTVAFLSLNKDRKILRAAFVFILLSTVSYNSLPGLIANSKPDLQKSVNKGPNIIIIGMDSLRPDCLAYYGNPKNIAPHANKFLENSISFNKAYTPLARTYPSWMSILTGAYPARSGIRYNLIKKHYLNKDVIPITTLLRDKYNYYTVHGIDETRFCNITHDDGFNELIHPVTGINDFMFSDFHDFSLTNLLFNNRAGGIFFPFIKKNRAVSHLYNGEQFVDDILLSMNNLMEKERFFLALHFCSAHWPYKSAHEDYNAYDDPPQYRERYIESLKVADSQIGIILDALKQRGMFNNSIIIFLSDHGENFGTSGTTWGHGTSLHVNTQNHIVLGIKPAGSSSHKKIDTIVSTVDIAPTILEMLKIQYDPARFDGKALLLGEQPSTKKHEDRYIFMETGFHLFNSFGKGLTMEEMIMEGSTFYEVSPETGRITVKDQYHQKIIDNKQFAVQSEKWKMVIQKNRTDNWDILLYDMQKNTELPVNIKTAHTQANSLLYELKTHFGISQDLKINSSSFSREGSTTPKTSLLQRPLPQ